tara:strand:- start:4412 stop:5524 length:1113 start_codon:yes stop_codon:yes gene_type:complete
MAGDDAKTNQQIDFIQPWNQLDLDAELVDLSDDNENADNAGEDLSDDGSLSKALVRQRKSASDAERISGMRTSQYIPKDLEDFRSYGDNERMGMLGELGMLDMSDVPTEGVPPMLAREGHVPPSISDEELFLLAKEPGVPLPEALMFQSTASGKTEMDLMPRHSRASIGRDHIPVLYDPEIPGATPNRWSFETPAPITPDRLYSELKTDVDRYNFLKRRKLFVDEFNERKEDYERQSDAFGTALVGAGSLVAGGPMAARAIPAAGRYAMGTRLGGMAYDAAGAVYHGVPKMIAAARNAPYGEWVGKLLKGKVIDQKWLLAADAAGVSGSLAIKKIHDQAQQIETQEDAIRGLQRAVSEIQEQEEPVSRAE